MNLLTNGNSLRSTDDYVSVTLKNPLWENMVGALHHINLVPKIASKYCAQYNGRYINKTVGLLWNTANQCKRHQSPKKFI